MRPLSRGLVTLYRVKILVLGSGAREHALVSTLRRDGGHELIVAPGNVGMSGEAELIRMDINKPSLVAEFAADEHVDLVVIGPEAPLVAGVADAVAAAGIPVFGPTRAAAQIEGSKTFAKDIMERAGVPTGRARLAHDLGELQTALDDIGAPYVVKADGLASGKGVIVTESRDEAVRHGEQWLSAGPLLVEEYLDGQEVSLFCFSDGTDVRALAPAQDFKRLHDNDAGPNTGGMGAYTPVPFLVDRFGGERAFMAEVVETVAQPVIDAMRAAGTPFQGLLYCGLIVTARGIRVIEFNARFGDPETQVVLERLAEPLAPLLAASATGTLGAHPTDLALTDTAVVGVVLASQGYPDQVRSGRTLTGIAAAEETGGRVYHAATAIGENEGEFVATGGRVLNIVATGTDLQLARAAAYTSLSQISLDGGQFRTDIAQLGAALQDQLAARAGSLTPAQAAISASHADAAARTAIEHMPPAPPTAEVPARDEARIESARAEATGSEPAESPAAGAVAAGAAAAGEDALPGWRKIASGKVREVYESLDDPDALLLVASDRVSAFDHILSPAIPGKGAMLTHLSRWWFDRLDVPNHLREPAGWADALPADLAARSMRVTRLQMLPIECVVRGYLTGSALKEYQQTGAVCGVPLPAGLGDGDPLPEPLFTPAFKAPQGEHDENISFERTVELVGEDAAQLIRARSLGIFAAASEIAADHGLVLADTKFEFGVDPALDDIVLGDEVLTSDSSRYWDRQLYDDRSLPLAERLASFDKQIVRNWLRENWDGQGEPPQLPQEIIDRTIARYRELLERLGSD